MLDDNVKTMQNKCGEIFINDCENFNFLCIFCNTIIKEIESFMKHIKSYHLELCKEKDSLEKTYKTPSKITQSVSTTTTTTQSRKQSLEFDFFSEINSKKQLNSSSIRRGRFEDVDSQFDSNITNYNDEGEEEEKEEEEDEEEKYSEQLSKVQDNSKECNQSLKQASVHRLVTDTEKITQVDSFKCRFCDHKFVNRKERYQHEHLHIGEKPYKCENCGTHFSTEYSYTIHNDKKLCKGKNILRKHKKLSSSPKTTDTVPSEKVDKKQNNEFSVIDANKTEKSPSETKQAVIENEGVKFETSIVNNSDDEVGKSFDDEREKSSDDESETSSEELSEKEENNKNNSSRMKTRSSDCISISKKRKDKVTLSCEICNNIFHKKTVLRSHLKYDHTLSTSINQESIEQPPLNDPFECRYCKRKFRSRKDRFEHECSHTGDKPYECHICGKRYSISHIYKKHLNFHKKEKPFKCQICEDDFTTRSNLTMHMRRHKYEKRFECRHCGKMFARKSNLDVHERAHTGEKPFQCSECGLCVISSSRLRVHTICHHINEKEKPYKCQFCARPFSANREKREHERIHTGEKPFICEICSASFRTGRSLKNHRKTHSNKSE